MAKIIEVLEDRYDVDLSDKAKVKLASVLIRNEYSKETIILNRGMICHDVYIVEKGVVRQFYYKNGRDISEHFSCEGDVFFCIESLFMKEPTTLLMEMIEPCIIYQLDYDKVQELCDD